VVGGLLSAHLMAATDPEISQDYDWSLLNMAEDMAKRLLPAFNTPTGLPYGTVSYWREDSAKRPCSSYDFCGF
jgi:mannosidase alpha-like ER degradation enhancer 2